MDTLHAPLPRTERYFPFEAFELAIHRDTRVLGPLYSGSVARGVADRYSDLDIDVWVAADAFGDLSAMLEATMNALGGAQFAYTRGPAFVTGFVGEDWQRVDLHLHGAEETKTYADYAGGRIVKDWDGTLTRIVSDAPVEHVTTVWEEARAVVEEAVDSTLYLTLHNARGETWSAAEEIVARLATSYTLLGSFRGRATFGFRYVGVVLTSAEQDV